VKPKKRINPAVASPQAPRALRAGSKGHARAEAAKLAGEPPPARQADDDEDEEDPEHDDDAKDQEAHDAACAHAAEQYRAAADAADAAKGTDSAAALEAGEAAHDDAMEAGAAFKSSCMAMRGVEPEHAAPPPPPGAQARALSSLAPGGSAAAHMEVAALAKFGRDTLARMGAANVGAGMLKLEAWAASAAEVIKLRAAERKRDASASASARHERLAAAVRAGMPRSHAFDVTVGAKGEEILTPKKCWTAGTLTELSAQLDEMGYRAGANVVPSLHLPAEAGGEAGLAARAASSGMTLDERRAAEANVNRAPAVPAREVRSFR